MSSFPKEYCSCSGARLSGTSCLPSKTASWERQAVWFPCSFLKPRNAQSYSDLVNQSFVLGPLAVLIMASPEYPCQLGFSSVISVSYFCMHTNHLYLKWHKTRNIAISISSKICWWLLWSYLDPWHQRKEKKKINTISGPRVQSSLPLQSRFHTNRLDKIACINYTALMH